MLAKPASELAVLPIELTELAALAALAALTRELGGGLKPSASLPRLHWLHWLHWLL